MDFESEINSNKDKSDFELLRNKIDCVHERMVEKIKIISKDNNSDIILRIRSRKIRIDNESESDQWCPTF